jgi:peptidoglycan/LPS O-acetylase OafA/YrhL
MHTSTSNFLNASRWVAAFLVVLFHVYDISFMTPPGTDFGLLFGFFIKGLHFFAGFGHAAVTVFFVVSGFLVGGRNILSIKEKGFDIREYFTHRFSRIYVVFIPALIFGFLIDCLGIKLFNDSGIYNHPDHFYTNPFGNNIADHMSLEIFAGNVMQLQTIIVSSLGSNGPLWSLANEWWYYVAFGFGLAMYHTTRMIIRIISGGIILGLVIFLPLTISLWFTIWAIGAGAAVLDRYWAGRRFLFGATIAIVCFTAVRWIDSRHMLSSGMGTSFAVDLTVALGYSAALVCAKNLKMPRKSWALHRTLASFSYTVYLVHFPAMIFVAAIMKDVFNVEFLRLPSVSAIIYAGALLTILYVYAWIFSVFTEAHTDAVRLGLSRLISALRGLVNSLVHTKVVQAANAVAASRANHQALPAPLAANGIVEAGTDRPH